MTDSEKFAKEPRIYLLLLAMVFGTVITAAAISLFGFESSGVLWLDYWQVAVIYIVASVVVGFLLTWQGFCSKPSRI